MYQKYENLLKIPIVAHGGAGQIDDFKRLFDLTSISAGIAGSSFVYYGARKAVLINYPNTQSLEALMSSYEV